MSRVLYQELQLTSAATVRVVEFGYCTISMLLKKDRKNPFAFYKD